MITQIDKAIREARVAMITESSEFSDREKQDLIKTAEQNVDVAKSNANHKFAAPSNSAEIIKEKETILDEIKKLFDGKLSKEKLSKETKKFLYFKMPSWGTKGT